MPKHTHNMSKTPVYKIWEGMKQRCHNPNHPLYRYYGGRGIAVCDEWRKSFEQFYAYIGPRPENLSVDRIDPEKGYEPGNVRWATRQTQIRNRRRNKNNLSGKVGVHFDIAKQRWIAELFVSGKRVYSRTFVEKDKAIMAREILEDLYITEGKDHLVVR